MRCAVVLPRRDGEFCPASDKVSPLRERANRLVPSDSSRALIDRW